MPEFPIPMLHIWDAYRRVRRRKGGNGFSVMPLEWPDIDAFSRLSGLSLVPWEVRMLEQLDDAFLKAAAEARE